MSFPKIPDMTSKIDIELEDALNLLITSIALEEINLSKLLNAETKEILYVLEEYELEKFSIQDVQDINRSVNQTIVNMIKIQTLLELKMEDIMELLYATTTTKSTTTTTTTTSSTSTTTTTSSTSTTTTQTTTSTTTTQTTTTKECEYSLIGKAKGYVSNPLDNFHNKAVYLKANIRMDNHHNRRALLYIIRNNIRLVASTTDLNLEYPSSKFPDSIVIRGNGTIKKNIKGQPTIIVNGSFILKVWAKEVGESCFQIEIKSEEMPELIHESGLVHTMNSNLLII